MKKLSSHFGIPFLLAALVTLIFGTIYVAVQQNYRLSANDPQIQMAEDVSQDLESGRSLNTLGTFQKTDLSKGLATFTMIFDKDGKVKSSTGLLDGSDPVLPNGVLSTTKTKGETRFTWEPKANVRIATVVKYFQGAQPGFVLIGRSLREVESRIERLTTMVGLARLASIIAIVFVFGLRAYIRKPSS